MYSGTPTPRQSQALFLGNEAAEAGGPEALSCLEKGAPNRTRREGAQSRGDVPPQQAERAGALPTLFSSHCASIPSRILCRNVSAPAPSFPLPPPPLSRPGFSSSGSRSRYLARDRGVPCCPGGGAEAWRRPSLRLPRGTCGCCGCCSPVSSSERL